MSMKGILVLLAATAVTTVLVLIVHPFVRLTLTLPLWCSTRPIASAVMRALAVIATVRPRPARLRPVTALVTLGTGVMLLRAVVLADRCVTLHLFAAVVVVARHHRLFSCAPAAMTGSRGAQRQAQPQVQLRRLVLDVQIGRVELSSPLGALPIENGEGGVRVPRNHAVAPDLLQTPVRVDGREPESIAPPRASEAGWVTLRLSECR